VRIRTKEIRKARKRKDERYKLAKKQEQDTSGATASARPSASRAPAGRSGRPAGNRG
jgi:hypothetical protein